MNDRVGWPGEHSHRSSEPLAARVWHRHHETSEPVSALTTSQGSAAAHFGLAATVLPVVRQRGGVGGPMARRPIALHEWPDRQAVWLEMRIRQVAKLVMNLR